MAEATFHVERRTETGRQAAKRLRNSGLVPGVVYGLAEEPEKLSMNSREILDMLHKYGRNVVVNLAIGSEKGKIKSFIYDIQHDPMSGAIIHVDFKRISLKEKIHIIVPIHLVGNPEGVKNEGGIVEHLMHTIEVSCLPTEIPESITLDISGLRLHDSIHVRDIKAEKFEITTEADRTIVHVVAPKVVAAPAAVEVEVPVEAAEPEVIGRKEKEEEEKE